MFASLSLPILLLIFSVSTIVVWISGIYLSNTTDIIDNKFGLGEALGGLIFLAVATNLPEIAITISASLTHTVGIAIGNILGGIAIQTVVLAILDKYGLGKRGALTYESASLQLVLEGTLVIIVLVIAIMGTQLPSSLIFSGIAPSDFFIVFAWLTGLWLINKARTHLPWQEKGRAPDTSFRYGASKPHISHNNNIYYVIFIFIVASIMTLIAGSLLELSSSAIASYIGWSGILFGSTILAAVTALPEVSTGLAAIKMGDYTLAISDIFGGNAFLPTLFLLATLLSHEPVLPLAQGTDIYLASLGALLTAIYIYGLIFRPKRQIFSLGIDSFIVVIVYLVGIIGLFTITKYQ